MTDHSEVPTKKRKIAFASGWLLDERYKSWICQVDGDEHLFYCSECKQNFSCSSGHVQRHYESHLKPKTNNTYNNTEKKKSTYKQKFCHKWLEDIRFKSWLKEVPNDPYSCRCSFCNVTLSCGVSKLERHLQVVEHKRKSKDNDLLVINSSEVDLNSFSFVDMKRIFEIRFSALVAQQQVAFTIGNECLKFFQGLFNHSDLGSLQVSRNKCR